ncbi:MAG: hypothetical protein WAO02_16475 [Verrucomicrobiia bacterium]
MIWLNLLAVVLVSGYVQWLLYRGWRFYRDLSRANAAEEVLKIVMEQRHFYFIQGIGGLIALTSFLGLKALLLIFKLPEPTAFTTFAFGDFASRFLIVKLGCLGTGLAVTSVACFYQCIKSNHYFEVLYALRDVLGLHPESNIPSAPLLAPSLTERQVL